MKRTILMIAASLAITVAGQAQSETVYQQMGAAMERESRAHMLEAQVAAAQEARERAKEAQEAAIAAARMQFEENAAHNERQKAYVKRFWEAIAEQNEHHAHPEMQIVELKKGDPLPLWNTFDDAATIKLYLRDSGYTDLSDAQILKVQDYMKAHGIRHVSELGQ